MDSTDTTPTEPVIQLTASAAEQVKSLLAAEAEPDGKSLRIYVEAGGCSGLQYGMVFDQPRDGDVRNEFFGAAVLIDSVSAEYLQGTVIDFVDSLNDGGFKISNPAARHSCGCGRSFEA